MLTIILAEFLILLGAYYSQNYASMIGQGLSISLCNMHSPHSSQWQTTCTTSAVPLQMMKSIAVSCCQLTPHHSPSQ